PLSFTLFPYTTLFRSFLRDHSFCVLSFTSDQPFISGTIRAEVSADQYDPDLSNNVYQLQFQSGSAHMEPNGSTKTKSLPSDLKVDRKSTRLNSSHLVI